MSRLTAIISAVVICLIVSLGWLANRYHTNATEFKRQRDEKTKALNLASATITDLTTRQRDVAALDAGSDTENVSSSNCREFDGGIIAHAGGAGGLGWG